MEVADAASDVFVSRDRERNDGDPTECEPWVTLDDVGGHVAAVVALTDHALVAGDFLAESVLAAHEEEEHCERK